MHACQQTVAIFSSLPSWLFSLHEQHVHEHDNHCTLFTMSTVVSEVSGKPEREASQNEMHGCLQAGWCGHFQGHELTLAVSLAQALPVQAAL